MTSPVTPQSELPESLQRQLKLFRYRLWRVKLTEAILAGLAGFILSYLILFLSDRFWTTPKFLSLTILIGGTLLSLFFAPYWIHRWVWKERRSDQLARLISRSFPHFGDRLLGIVELQDTNEDSHFHSPTLRRAAIQQVAKDAEELNFLMAVPNPRHKLAIGLIFVLSLLLALIIWLAPEAGVNTLARWAMPMSDVPRYTFTRLENVPKILYVPAGEAFHLTIKLDPQSKRQISNAFARCGGREWQEYPMKSDADSRQSATFSFPGIHQEEVIDVTAGDARYSIPVVPCLRPTIRETTARVTYPEYTGRQEESVSLKTGTLYALKDSKIRLRIESTNPLQSAELIDAAGKSSPLPVQGSWVRFPEQLLQNPAEFSFNWTDEHGISAKSPFKIRLEPTEDNAPEIYLQATSREIYVLERENVELEILATDDFGILDLGIRWAGHSANEEKTLLTGKKEDARLNTKFIFQAAELGIRPQKLTFQAFVKDHKPGRENKYSAPITVYVMDKNEHAQMIRGELERITTEVEELTQQQQLQTDESQRLKALEDGALMSPDTQTQIKDLANAEEDNAEKLRALTENMKDLFRKALRNDQIDAEALRPFHKAQSILEKIPDNSQKQAKEALNQAAQDNNTPKKTKNDLAQAEKNQKESLEKLKSALGNISEASKNLEAGTFVARLKQAAVDEKEVGNSTSRMLGETIGLATMELPESFKRLLTQNMNLQKIIGRNIRWIADDLSGFFTRSKIEVHGKVATEMQNLLIEQSLENLINEIDNNHGGITVEESARLEKIFLQWAAMIEGTKNKKGDSEDKSGGSSEEDEESMSDSDFDFMLKVMRMIQTQQDIRTRTRVLDEERVQTGTTAAAPRTVPQTTPTVPPTTPTASQP